MTTGENFGDPTPYALVATLDVDSMESLGAAFGAHADEILGDIPNSANVQPVTSVGSVA